MTTTPTLGAIADANPQAHGYGTLQSILREALKGKEGQISLAEAGLIELNHASATIGALIDAIEGTQDEGTDHHLALWAASRAIENARILIATAVSRPAGNGGVR